MFAVSVCVWPFYGSASKWSNDNHPWNFISACKVGASDRHFESGSILALVYEMNKAPSGAILYHVTKLNEGEIPPTREIFRTLSSELGKERFVAGAIASLVHESQGIEGPQLEAQGGVASMLIAQDVIEHLQGQEFYLVDDWTESLLGRESELQLRPCGINYCTHGEYERREVQDCQDAK